MTDLQKINKISELIHTLQTIANIEYMVELSLIGIQIIRRFRSKTRKSREVDISQLVYTKSDRDRAEKAEQKAARKMQKLALDESVMISGVMMGSDPKESFEAIGLSDYRQWITQSYDDPFKFKPSSAIWDYMNNASLTKKLEKIISDGQKNGTDYLTIVKRLESSLGVDQQYPRWLRSRIFSITPPRQNKTTGLLRRPTHLNHLPRSFAYNAIRMMVTQVGQSFVNIQTRFAVDNPYITRKKVVLSPYHPMCDKCDKVASVVWMPEDAPLLVHPHCLCYYRVVVTQKTIDRLRASLRNETDSNPSKRLDALRSMFPFAISGVANYLFGEYDI